jgi:hypothetical protein
VPGFATAGFPAAAFGGSVVGWLQPAKVKIARQKAASLSLVIAPSCCENRLERPIAAILRLHKLQVIPK